MIEGYRITIQTVHWLWQILTYIESGAKVLQMNINARYWYDTFCAKWKVFGSNVLVSIFYILLAIHNSFVCISFNFIIIFKTHVFFNIVELKINRKLLSYVCFIDIYERHIGQNTAARRIFSLFFSSLVKNERKHNGRNILNMKASVSEKKKNIPYKIIE